MDCALHHHVLVKNGFSLQTIPCPFFHREIGNTERTIYPLNDIVAFVKYELLAYIIIAFVFGIFSSYFFFIKSPVSMDVV